MNLLTTVHNNGIVTVYQIAMNQHDAHNRTQVQLIWNEEIHCTIIGLNSEPDVHDHKSIWSIRKYRAIYINGIMIVQHGRVWPKKRVIL